MTDKVKKVVDFILFELIVMLCFNIVMNNYVGHQETKINADGIGYYEYLPSQFIHDDLNRKNVSEKDNPSKYNRVRSFGSYVEHEGYLVNKSPVGTALLQSPFFFVAWSLQPEKSGLTGYEKPFQQFIFYASIFYLFLMLLFFKAFLSGDIKRWLIHILQLFLVLATSVTHYGFNEAAYSHIYSLFTITMFLFFVKRFFTEKKGTLLLLACAALGLATIVRPTNLLVVLFIPFVLQNTTGLKEGVITLKQKWKPLIFGGLIFAGFIIFQMYLWNLQTGSWLVYSYGEEGFNFSSPEIFNVLFSYKKGLFIYTPVLLFVFPALFRLAIKKRYYMVLSWVIPMSIVTYVISSWWCWDYGASFGMRPYIEYYTLFFILFAFALNDIKPYMQVLFIALAGFTIPVNVIQTYQYEQYILSWQDMNKERYWKVFLKTDDTYKGWLWKRELDLKKWFHKEQELTLGNFSTQGKQDVVILETPCDSLMNFHKISVIELSAKDVFADGDHSYCIMEINDTVNNTNLYWYQFYFSILAEKQRGQLQTGRLLLEMDPVENPQGKVLKLGYHDFTEGKELKQVKVTFYRPK